MSTITEQIQKVLDERASLFETEGKPLADIAAERAFTAEETERSEKVDTAMDAFERRLATLRQQKSIEDQVKEFRDVLANDDTLRTAIETELRAVLVEKSKAEADFRFTGKELTRALSVGTAGAGGNTVPTTFLEQLLQGLRDFSSVVAAGATIFTTESGEEITVPRVATFGAAGQFGEGATIAGTDPTFDQVKIKAYKLGQLIRASRELLEDGAFDVEGFIVGLIAENIGMLAGARYAVGTGSSQTLGIIPSSTVGKTGATGVGGAPTFDDMIDLHYSVTGPYRRRGSWLVADGALASLRKLKASGSGEYLWVPAVTMGQPDLILGKPVYADPNMAAPAVGAKSVGFGDVSRYWVRIVNSLRVDRSDHAAFSTDEVAFRGTLRTDGVLTDASAFKVFQGGAS